MLLRTKQLYYLLKGFTTLGPDNWRKYQNLVLPVLTDGRSLGLQPVSQRSEEGGSTEIDEARSRLDCIGGIITSQPPFVLPEQFER